MAVKKVLEKKPVVAKKVAAKKKGINWLLIIGIIVALIVIAGIGLFIVGIIAAAIFAGNIAGSGVFSPSSCSGFDAFGYVDHSLDSDGDLELIVTNNAGAAMRISDIAAQLEGDNDAYSTSGEGELAAGQQRTITASLPMSGMNSGDSYNLFVGLEYEYRGFTYAEFAMCTGTVE